MDGLMVGVAGYQKKKTITLIQMLSNKSIASPVSFLFKWWIPGIYNAYRLFHTTSSRLHSHIATIFKNKMQWQYPPWAAIVGSGRGIVTLALCSALTVNTGKVKESKSLKYVQFTIIKIYLH